MKAAIEGKKVTKEGFFKILMQQRIRDFTVQDKILLQRCHQHEESKSTPIQP